MQRTGKIWGLQNLRSSSQPVRGPQDCAESLYLRALRMTLLPLISWVHKLLNLGERKGSERKWHLMKDMWWFLSKLLGGHNFILNHTVTEEMILKETQRMGLKQGKSHRNFPGILICDWQRQRTLHIVGICIGLAGAIMTESTGWGPKQQTCIFSQLSKAHGRLEVKIKVLAGVGFGENSLLIRLLSSSSYKGTSPLWLGPQLPDLIWP